MTNAELLKRIALPSGEAVRVDEPGLPTKDILFADPYNEEKLLKIAAPIKWAYAIGVINVHREGKSIRDTIRLDQLPWLVKHEEFAYYMVNSGRKGVVRRGEAIDIELRELEADVVILAPIVNERAVIGIKEYLLPPYPVDLLEERIAKTRVDGTLLIYADGSFQELKARRDEFIEL